MKRTVLVVVLVLALTFVFAASAFATTGKFFTVATSYYKWTNPDNRYARAYVCGPVPAIGVGTVTVGFRAPVGGPTPPTRARTPTTWPRPPSAACATRSTARQETASSCCRPLTPPAPAATPAARPSRPRSSRGRPWIPPGCRSTTRTARPCLNEAAAGGGGGPHNDPRLRDTATGVGRHRASAARATLSSPVRSLRLLHPPLPRHQPAWRGQLEVHDLRVQAAVQRLVPQMTTRRIRTWPRCMALAPTVDSTPSMTTSAPPTRPSSASPMPTRASSPSPTSEILINGDAPDPDETHALVAGLTCGRPSNVPTGEDECHAEAAYAIVDKGIGENRNHATGAQQNPYATDNTGEEAPGWAATTTATRRPVTSPVRSQRSGDCLVRADRRLHELPRSDRLGQHRCRQLHVPARPDRDR